MWMNFEIWRTTTKFYIVTSLKMKKTAAQGVQCRAGLQLSIFIFGILFENRRTSSLTSNEYFWNFFVPMTHGYTMDYLVSFQG